MYIEHYKSSNVQTNMFILLISLVLALMTDTALIFELTLNVLPGQGMVEKNGSYYDVTGTFILDDTYSHVARVIPQFSFLINLYICIHILS